MALVLDERVGAWMDCYRLDDRKKAVPVWQQIMAYGTARRQVMLDYPSWGYDGITMQLRQTSEVLVQD